MQPEQSQKLREPFPASQIGKLPRVSCGDCRNASGKVCGKHAKAKCSVCGNWITAAHIHLDYVGHAETTARLLEVDPEWTWEPVAFTPDGLPALDSLGGLWLRLTVCGVTRYGYGHADGKKGADAVKEAIGDALRNAAMRFGVALDLWAKTDLHANAPEPENPHHLPVAAAKNELLAAYGGDKAAANEAWGKRDHITRSELDDLLTLAEQMGGES